MTTAGMAITTSLPYPILAASVPNDPLDLDAVGQAGLIARRDVSALELVEAAILRIEARDPKLNTIVTPCYERAIAAAKNGLPAGIFRGVPYLIKDVMNYPGVRTTSGSRSLVANFPTEVGDYARAIERTGLNVVGKSATPEFALLPTTEPVLTGLTRNPWGLGHSTAGSSGGSAAAVAAGLVPFAHASDGGGSIRNPASACGLFGLKPSSGRLIGSAGKASSGAIGVNHCVSRSVRDSATLFAVTERNDSEAFWPPVGLVSGPSKRRLRIAYSTINLYGRDAEPEVKQVAEAAARLCEKLGHHVEQASIPVDGELFLRRFFAVYSKSPADAVAAYAKRSGKVPDESVMEVFTLGMAADHRDLPQEAIPEALEYFTELEQSTERFFDDYEITLTPVLRLPPPKLGYMNPMLPYKTVLERVIDYASYTPLHNAAGIPAMSLPLGRTKSNLPIGVHFATRQGGERTLFELAYEIEAAAAWQRLAL